MAIMARSVWGRMIVFEFFPAMSLGWVASGEDFWKPIEKYVNYFKIRGSYGLVGSDETGLQANPAAAALFVFG